MNEVKREQLMKLAQSLDVNHPDYDEIWATLLFNGKDPNALTDSIRYAIATGAVKEEARPEVKVIIDQWQDDEYEIHK